MLPGPLTPETLHLIPPHLIHHNAPRVHALHETNQHLTHYDNVFTQHLTHYDDMFTQHLTHYDDVFTQHLTHDDDMFMCACVQVNESLKEAERKLNYVEESIQKYLKVCFC